jgi:hypothetical protein
MEKMCEQINAKSKNFSLGHSASCLKTKMLNVYANYIQKFNFYGQPVLLFYKKFPFSNTFFLLFLELVVGLCVTKQRSNGVALRNLL